MLSFFVVVDVIKTKGKIGLSGWEKYRLKSGHVLAIFPALGSGKCDANIYFSKIMKGYKLKEQGVRFWLFIVSKIIIFFFCLFSVMSAPVCEWICSVI